MKVVEGFLGCNELLKIVMIVEVVDEYEKKLIEVVK